LLLTQLSDGHHPVEQVMSQVANRVVYVATGQRYIREAASSLGSLWRHQSGTPVTMYVDRASRPHLKSWGIPLPPDEESLEILDHPNPTYSWADKPLALCQGGREQESILSLDTDTRICGTITEIFQLLDSFDLAAAHAPIRLDSRQPGSLARRAPVTFPELNTGVMAFRRTKIVAELFERWRSMHLEFLGSMDRRILGDQATFRVALFESKIRFAVLPPEYNCRIAFPTYVHGPVRIIHGRGPDLEHVERQLNQISAPRVFVPGVGVLKTSGTA
jgi:hypothetical protein